MRVEHWERVLVEHVAAAREAPFVWGSHDCVTFAAGVVKAITGRDALEGIPAWADPRSARRAIEAAGGLSDAITGLFGEPINPAMAQRGDVATLKADATPEGIEATGWTVAVCVGDYFIAPGVGGLCRIPLDAVDQAWRVE